MLTAEQVGFYGENGYVTVEGVVPLPIIEEARQVVDDLVERSRSLTDHDRVYDLEPGHSAAEPRVRRIKEPCAVHPLFDRISRHGPLLDCVAALIGPSLRYQGSKLNMKAAAYGAPVEWHQDFAFYPHSNDDLLAVGLYLDDCNLENGCMLMVPGSHRWPILDHHQDGMFVGAVDVERQGIDTSKAVPVTVKAGGISLHHTRMLHGSACNTSSTPRRLFLLQMAAADAWPMLGVADLAQFDRWMLRGDAPRQYRVKEMDVRVPLPKPERAGSIYEIQTAFRSKVFAG